MSRLVRPSLRAFQFSAVFALTAGSLIAGLPSRVSADAGVNAGAAVSAPQVLGWGFGQPNAVSSDGTDVWVLNSNGNSVTELSAATGALVQFISGSKYRIKQPEAISSDGTHVWVANSPFGGGSVTELSASTGALVQVIKGAQYGFAEPEGISSDGTHVWVPNSLTNSVTELSAATGALVQIISGASYGFGDPRAISSDGTHVWVPDPRTNSVTELSAATGALVQVISGASYGFDQPETVSSDGHAVWVANVGDSVTELERGDGCPGPGDLGRELRVRCSRGGLFGQDRRLGSGVWR